MNENALLLNDGKVRISYPQRKKFFNWDRSLAAYFLSASYYYRFQSKRNNEALNKTLAKSQSTQAPNSSNPKKNGSLGWAQPQGIAQEIQNRWNFVE